MSPRLKASRVIDIRGVTLQPGDVFKARPRNATRLVAAGDAEPVNVENKTAKESKRSRRSDKNATRRSSGR